MYLQAFFIFGNMKIQLSYVALALLASSCAGKLTYEQSIEQYRTEYKKGFLFDERAPLEAEDTADIQFYPINKSYKVIANLEFTPDATPFDIPTANGATKKYRQYGLLSFSINDTPVTLQVFQSLKLIAQEEYKDHLFLPFTDATTHLTSYGGGRYLDLSKNDIHDGKIELDFNKSYNPWCAFGEGYSCPIPPKENRLPIAITAGEMKFGKSIEH